VIIDLPSTSTSAINKRMVDLRETGGAIALGRVLTLVIVTDDIEAEEAIAAANDASREHPCRVLVLARGSRRGAPRLDAQIRVGGDAGASEVIVLRLYGELVEHGDSVLVPLLLPDAPVVAWWPGTPPKHPAKDPIGAMAQRRITDSEAAARPRQALRALGSAYADGDTDLAWTRITLWRGLLAAALDQATPEPVTSATVAGASDSPSTDLLAAWLAMTLDCPVTRSRRPAGTGLSSVRLDREPGPIQLVRPEGDVATLTQPGQPDRRVALPRRNNPECLAEELRRLDPDDIYGEVVTTGLERLEAAAAASSAARRRGGAA
jgi:glucose-6-phosphate dehydrogenase assembly protein OpcA